MAGRATADACPGSPSSHSGRDLTRFPLCERRQRLEDLVAGRERIFPVRRLAANGMKAWAQVIERGYEGYVAKDGASVYEGGATKRWLKVKQKDWAVKEDGWRQRISALAPPSSTGA
jgi:ATP-dependent DNA ligase